MADVDGMQLNSSSVLFSADVEDDSAFVSVDELLIPLTDDDDGTGMSEVRSSLGIHFIVHFDICHRASHSGLHAVGQTLSLDPPRNKRERVGYARLGRKHKTSKVS